ncbi:uncharacterized protein J7T54_001067 [Emericellopsis cladophorae]|uniref:Uncharacterized protein n=1 Tax=Emericellopsis cladophorae TaxID=2686198 RepID=A0A9P9XZH5_9HYPO|nr:uncharacterized protein J7T54_001067 [Emericellopsis cladophorae]KAI6780759.1 hypothetical protein J7T54_001067 [Emericellopsis cladophorae]
MCFRDLATLSCTTCHRAYGQIAASTHVCGLKCGTFLNRSTDKHVNGECAVCAGNREESARRAAALRRFGSNSSGTQA